MTSVSAIFETQLSKLRLKARGKVRDIYDLGETLLIVATDRILNAVAVIEKYGSLPLLGILGLPPDALLYLRPIMIN